MLYCPTCRQGYEDGTDTCPQCNESLVADSFKTPCPLCGAENRINRTFCGKCGYFFVRVKDSRNAAQQTFGAGHAGTAEAVAEDSSKCSRCGREVGENQKFCANCGMPLAGQDGYTPDQLVYPPQSPRSPHWAWLNLFIPGLAHMVFGQVGKGLLVLIFVYSTVPVPFIALALWIASIVDAYRVGKCLKEGHPVGKWQCLFPRMDLSKKPRKS